MLKCCNCGYTSVTFDPFWDLSLPIPRVSQLSSMKLETRALDQRRSRKAPEALVAGSYSFHSSQLPPRPPPPQKKKGAVKAPSLLTM